MTKVCIQIGHAKFAKEGQLIEAEVNGEKIVMKDGDFLSPMSSRKFQIWYMKPVDCNTGDLIVLTCKTGLRFLGSDEERSFTATFRVNEDLEESEFKVTKCGYGNGFPLIKGKIEEVSFINAKDRRLLELKAKMEGINHEPTSGQNQENS